MSESTENGEYLREQYRDASNLNARINLHQRFSVNQYGWFRWVFDHFQLPANSHILELGCGPGSLWKENLDRIPPGWAITLSDFSQGMVQEARGRLKDKHCFQFKVINAATGPYPIDDACMDAVIANHMIYHVSKKAALFSEARRILKPGGRLFATTAGEQHLSEIGELLTGFDPSLSFWGNMVETFSLENGADQLAQWFPQVERYRYEDELRVTEAAPLVDFILSGWIDLPEEKIGPFKAYVDMETTKRGGALHIRKDSGLFVAKMEPGGEDV